MGFQPIGGDGDGVTIAIREPSIDAANRHSSPHQREGGSSSPTTTKSDSNAPPSMSTMDGPSTRWNKGRNWDGIGGDWCDEETARAFLLAQEQYSESNPNATLAQFLERATKAFADKRAITYLDGKGDEVVNHSFGDVWDYVCRISAYLQREMGIRPGDRAVLLYSPGQEFILAFVACIRAGIVAVPVYPPHPYRFEKEVPILNRIVTNSNCKVALTDSQYFMIIRGVAVKNMLSRVGLAKQVTWPNLHNVQTDKIRRSYAHKTLLVEPRNKADDLAFLQYTSGSTSLPKGVMVSHGNLLAQARLIALRTAEVMGYTNNQSIVSWLPQYHDMGLIGIFVVGLSMGVHVIYLPPYLFLQDPTLWLKAVSKYKAQNTCAPNFAFALAQRKTSEALRDALDLRNLKIVVCGAEPIRMEIMHSFFDYFKPCGFNPSSLLPSYGLAEFTLCATSAKTGRPLNCIYIDQQLLASTGRVVVVHGKTPGAVAYVGVGNTLTDGSVCRIVDPTTRECMGEGRIGEIWLDGPSKTKGYFDDPEKTAAAFRGLIKGNEDAGHVYLQTGDQGFLYQNQLFITGRIKDLIIIRGRNIYPQDVEFLVDEALAEYVRPGCSAAFEREVDREQTIACVAELRELIKDQGLLREIAETVRRLVADTFQACVSVVIFVGPRSIPKTTSGKIQRHRCKLGYHEGTLKEIYRWETVSGGSASSSLSPPTAAPDIAASPSSFPARCGAATAVREREEDELSEASFASAQQEEEEEQQEDLVLSPSRMIMDSGGEFMRILKGVDCQQQHKEKDVEKDRQQQKEKGEEEEQQQQQQQHEKEKEKEVEEEGDNLVPLPSWDGKATSIMSESSSSSIVTTIGGNHHDDQDHHKHATPAAAPFPPAALPSSTATGDQQHHHLSHQPALVVQSSSHHHHHHHQQHASPSSSEGGEDGNEEAVKTAYYINQLVNYISHARNIPRDSIDIDQSMSLFGFDSLGFVSLGRTMGDWVGKEMSPAIVYKFTTIREVAGFLARGARDEELTLDVVNDVIPPDLDSPIAIVGIGCKAPGGPKIGNLVGRKALWDFIVQGGSALREDMPAERKVDRTIKIPGNYLDGIDQFDTEFFDFSAAEASHMDYHQCHVLQTAWHALEDAGIDPKSLSGHAVGTYIGAISHEFAVLESLRGEKSVFQATGTGNSLVAGRLSHFLNVRGPAVVVDTACSSSLVAIHNAVKDLRLGHCSLALAGGVNLLLTSETSSALKQSGLLATDCRPFDAAAMGFCRGEGCGIVVLKRLSRALADGDRVYAVIKGSAIQHDGRTVNLTTPNPLAQEDVIKAAMREAGVKPHQVKYIEAHGAGTRLGDTMEMSALGAVMNGRDLNQPCLLGTYKPNIGYMEASCGVFSLIRTALILYHGLVPRLIKFENPNPFIPWDRLPFKVPVENTSLEDPQNPSATIFAGATAVGFSGTNAHAVLESMPKSFCSSSYVDDFEAEEGGGSNSFASSRLPLLLPISARAQGALRRLAVAYADLLSSKDIAHRYDRTMDLCLDASTRRSHHSTYRLAAVGRTAKELRVSLFAQAANIDVQVGPLAGTSSGESVDPEVVFVFNGSQEACLYRGIGRALYTHNLVFRANVDEVDRLFKPYLGDNQQSIVQNVFLAATEEADDASPFPSSLLLQPALFGLQYGMMKVWNMLKVKPTFTIGHSFVGEVLAAIAAGCLTLEEGVCLVATVSKAMDALLPRGQTGCTTIYEAEETIRPLLGGVVCDPPLKVAAINGPSSITIAGPVAGLVKLEEVLSAQSLVFKRLDVPYAYHSSAMEVILPTIRTAFSSNSIAPRAPQANIKMLSSLTGSLLTSAPDAIYFMNLLRQPVLFYHSLCTLGSSKSRVLIELGPDSTLSDLAQKVLGINQEVIFVSSMKKERHNDETLGLVEAFAAAYIAKIPLNFKALRLGDAVPSTIDLPLYPFEPIVTLPLGQLTGTALSRVDTSENPNIQKDAGVTYLLEEGWLPRVKAAARLPGEAFYGARNDPPEHVVYICSDPADAAALANVKVLSKRSHRIVVPCAMEAATWEMLGTVQRQVKGETVSSLDFLARGDGMKNILRGPEGVDGVAVIYLASAAGSLPHYMSLDNLADEAFGESARLLSVLRAMAELGLGEKLRLWVVTTQAKLVTSSDRVKNLGGILWSMTKSALQECYPSVWATLIDLPGRLASTAAYISDQEEINSTAARFVALMDHDLKAYAPHEPPLQLALRHGEWLVMRLKKSWMECELDLRALRAAEGMPDVFPLPGVDVVIKQTRGKVDNGVDSWSDEAWHLVTGGTTLLGLHAAAALIRHGARRLLLTHGSDVKPTGADKVDLSTLLALPHIEIKVIHCDMGDRAAVGRLFTEASTSGGIRGIIRCDGHHVDGSLRNEEVDNLETAWRGRVDGAIHLHEFSARQGRPLDLFLIYGSSSALMGAANEASMAASSAALDSLALLRRQQGLCCTIIQWASWSGLRQPDVLDQLAFVGFLPVTKGIAGLVLTALLNKNQGDLPVIVCCHPIDWARVVANGPDYMLKSDLACFEPIKNRVAPKRQVAKMTEELRAYAELETEEARLKMIKDVLTDSIRESTGKEIEPDQNLLDCGVTTAEGVELVNELRRRFPINFELNKLLEYPSMDKLAPLLAIELDRSVDGNVPLPLSKGQRLAVSSGFGRAFLFAEVHLPAHVATQTLLAAWRKLIARHANLRTTFELQDDVNSAFQRLLAISDVDVGELFGTLPETGSVRDLSSLEEALKQAADRMGLGSPSHVFLAISRLLTDKASLRVFAAELIALTTNGMTLSAPMPSFIEKLRLLSKSQPTHRIEKSSSSTLVEDLSTLEASPSQDGNGDKAVNTSASLKTQSSASSPIARFASYTASHSIGGHAELSSKLAQELDTYAIKKGISPATVLLTAYAMALRDSSSASVSDHEEKEGGISIVVDMPTIGQANVLGPVSMPFILLMSQAEINKEPRALASHVQSRIEEALDALQIPDNPMKSELLDLTLPAFCFQERETPGVEMGSAGEVRHCQQQQHHHHQGGLLNKLELVVTTGQASDGESNKYGIELRSDQDMMTMGDVLAAAVVENVQEILRPGGGRHRRHFSSSSSSLRGLGGSVWRSSFTSSRRTMTWRTGTSSGTDASAWLMNEGEEGGGSGGGVGREESWDKDSSCSSSASSSFGTAAAAAASRHHQPLPYWSLLLLQLMGMILMGTVIALPALLVWPGLQFVLDHFNVYIAYALCPLAYHALGLLTAAQVFVLRELLVRGVPGEYAINSWPFLKWWFMRRMIGLLDSVYMNNIQGTALYTCWLRLLGARIGDNVRIMAGAQLPDPDMLILGDNAIIDKAELMGSIVKDGVLRRGIVEMGPGGKVGTHAVMLPGSSLGRNAELRPLSVAVERQKLPENGIYEGSPAGFFKPRGDIAIVRPKQRTVVGQVMDVIGQTIILLAAPTLSVLAASMAYPVMAYAGEAAGIFPFLTWSDWQEGRLLLALSTASGIVPLLGLPTLVGYMKFQSKAMLMPDQVMMNFAAAAGYRGSIETVKSLFTSDKGIALIKSALPEGVDVFGEPGPNLHFSSTGRQVLRYVALDGISLPTARMYYVAGVFWVFALGFLLQGFILTALTNLVYYMILGCTAHSAPRRVDGFKSTLRQIKVTILRWTYDKFMRLFAGTNFLPFWYWTLGTRVGKRVVISNIDVIEDPHLVSLGDDVALVDYAVLETIQLPGNGYALGGPVSLGRDCILGVRAVVGPNVVMGEGAVIMPQSSVPPDSRVDPDYVMSGVPVSKVLDLGGVTSSNRQCNCQRTAWVRYLLITAPFQNFLIPLLSAVTNLLLMMMAAYPASLFLFWVMSIRGLDWPILYAQLALPIVYTLYSTCLLLIVVIHKWLMRWKTIAKSKVPIGGLAYHARTHTLVLEAYAVLSTLDTIRGSVYVPLYLRLLGSKVHPTAYVDTLHVTEPDLLTIGKKAIVDHNATIMANTLENHALIYGMVKIEALGRLGVASTILRDCSVGRQGELGDASYLPPTQWIRPGSLRIGAGVKTDNTDMEEEGLAGSNLITMAIKI